MKHYSWSCSFKDINFDLQLYDVDIIWCCGP